MTKFDSISQHAAFHTSATYVNKIVHGHTQGVPLAKYYYTCPIILYSCTTIISPQPSTRGKHNRMGEADNSEDEQGAHAVTNHTTDVVPNPTDLIYTELSKTNLSGEMLTLANIICKIIP